MVELIFAISLLLIRLAIATPTISLPINSQVPPVAHVSELYDFAFSGSTFTSSDGSISYTLSGAPAWLQVNSTNNTLSGTPTASDVGSTSFDLTATDSTGSTNMSVTLVVLNGDGPTLGAAILPQLEKFGATSSPASLLLSPSQTFTITFDSDTFSGTSSSTSYYATSGNNTPLPSWLDFNAQNLAFSGTTPPLLSTMELPQVYPVRFTASDVVGFAGAIATFDIVVEANVLSFNVTYQTFNPSTGQYFQTPSLSGELNLNNLAISSSDIADVTSDAPSWLTLHTQNVSLSGIPPSDAESQNVTITVTDVYGDVANTTINLDFSNSGLFNGTFSTVNATIGQSFEYDVGSEIAEGTGIDLSVDLGSTATWLSYDDSTKKLSGSVPSDASTGMQNVKVTAQRGTSSQTQTLPINIVRRSVVNTVSSSTKSSSSTSSTSSSSASRTSSKTSHTASTSSATSKSSSTTTATLVMGKDSNNNAGRNLAIVLGVLLPILLLLLLALLILCCFRRRRRQREMKELEKSQISRPIVEEPGPAVVTEISSDGDVLEKERTQTPEPAPRVELPWAPDSHRKARARLSKKSSQYGSPLIGADLQPFLTTESPPIPPRSSRRSSKTSSKRTSWKSRKAAVQTPPARNSSTLNYSRKRMPFGNAQSRTLQDVHPAKRASRAMSNLSAFSSSLPSRLSGMGHGNGGLGPPGYLQVRDSWQNPRNSLQPSEMSGRDSTVDLERFPNPPGEVPESSRGGSERGTRASLRLVHSGSLQRSSISEERQRYVRDRARDRVEGPRRFSSAWSMRPSSSRGSKGIMEKMRSPAITSSIYPDDRAQRDTWRTYSKSSSIAPRPRPETITSEDELYEEPMRPPPLVLRDRPSFSTGQFDTADESTEDSNWEDEDLEEAFGPNGERRWQVSANNSPLGSPLERPLDFGEAGLGSSLSSRPSTSRGHPPPRRVGTNERRWRLGDRRDRRPVSVTENDMHRTQGSQRGNLAFV